MTAPISLREYFATAGSTYTKADADVIGPQIEALAEEGDASERRIVDTAKSTNSPLHGFFDWNDATAADKHRLHTAGTMLKAIRVRTMEDGRPRVTPAYRVQRAQPKSAFARGHNVLHGESAAAVQKAREAFDDLTGWRARYSPFVMVWRDFAQAFRGVTNQIGEAEDVVRAAALDDRTDDALTELGACLAALTAWREKHEPTAETWAAVAEQGTFLCEAIDEAVAAFTAGSKAKERTCLRCSKPFQSVGPENRLCDRCAGVSTVATSRL